MIGAREAAYRSLVRCAKDNKFANLEIDSAIKKFNLEGAERSLYTVLVYGTIERMLTLDFYLSNCSDKPIDKLDFSVLTILRLCAYQILFLDRIPDHAAVNESVELAKRNAPKGSAGFVNAVLRKLIECKDKLELPNLSVRYSVPEWITELWCSQYGHEKAVEILEGMDKPPVMTLRVNTLVTERDWLLNLLTEKGIKAEKTEHSPVGIHIMQGISFMQIVQLCGNSAYVQDEASQLTVEAVDASQNEFVIDTCSCPGGKSFGMAMCMDNRGKLLSLDLHKSKLSLVDKGAVRLGIDIIETREHDGKSYIEEFYHKADRVLCDVPCSGLGVMAKKPETRYKDREAIERLPEIQYSILSASSAYLKDGGVLVYSTCTLNKNENENVVERFISENKEFTLDSMITHFPVKGKSDGFFHAKLLKCK
ncbi:MAG: 16S rRNA (cytosine(967)-C(5))-methyltransferase RsmB [Ruminococcaceae bacterium]|nr:16S rRNA (cytosine(967)-C(5))-methyltransferase RsmB [Oscillospiraceae bacterium]